MIKYFLFVYIFISASLFTQTEKYLIYFTDKGSDAENSSLSKEAAKSLLTQDALERRLKTNLESELIGVEDLPINEAYLNTISDLNIKIINELRWFNAISAHLNIEQINSLNALPFVKKIEPVKSIKFKSKFDFDEFSSSAEKINIDNYPIDYGQSLPQNALSEIPLVHESGITGEGVLIGFLDTGFDWSRHVALKDLNVVGERDFIQGDSITANQTGDVFTQHNHGTYVMSIAVGFDEGRLVGPAFNASVMLAKTENVASETQVEEDNFAAALEWMEARGVDIISSSLGYSQFDNFSYEYADMDGQTTIVAQAVEIAYQKGVVMITSAGNEGNSSWRYITSPADAFNVITVGSVTSSGTLSSFSSRGPTADGRIKPEVVAMGSSVYGASAGSEQGYSYASGTSASTPVVAGIAAQLLSAFPHLTNEQVRHIFLETADRSENPDNDYGYGLLSAKKALTFPNVDLSDNNYRLNKIFLNETGVDNATIKFYLSRDGVNFEEKFPISAVSNRFIWELENRSGGERVDFYFTYQDSVGGELIREPEGEKFFSFVYGTNNVGLILKENIEPEEYTLYQNYPNPFPSPFNSSTIISFYAKFPTKAKLKVYDILGREVKTLFNGEAAVGRNIFRWDGDNNRGTPAASGVYYYVLETEGQKFAKKLILLK